MIASFEVGTRPGGIDCHLRTASFYRANSTSVINISVVNLASQAVIKRIKVGDRPWGVITLAR